ncbi:hypothetical protein [Williamsia phyllosphaerae]|uniref:Uncharacterized protein n=1 Tax=Williamsia phyllosphaerae TaxID=885042 RepID=A0ABQ1V5V3_9NOCA|nr:hypothetical protein [Williamsia phyllosphaerae]GGF38935.1 hypothetical protein GCM10007298_38280 [Williamsia phyllosphaerae]
MTLTIIFVAGVATPFALYGLGLLAWSAYDYLTAKWTASRDFTTASASARRFLIINMVEELMQASHARAFRFPGNRVFLIRSTPRHEFDPVANGYILITGKYDKTSRLMNGVFDEIGFAVPDEVEEP